MAGTSPAMTRRISATEAESGEEISAQIGRCNARVIVRKVLLGQWCGETRFCGFVQNTREGSVRFDCSVIEGTDVDIQRPFVKWR